MYYNQRLLFKRLTVFLLFLLVLATIALRGGGSVFATPFYDLKPKEIVLRAKFYTTYSASSEERKSNIALAVKALDNTLLSSGDEFSFNRTVGARTAERGYKTAKIIVNGEFVDGVGGGVCQVSTTLYNAVLLAGLDIIEYHPHSLPVSYVAPSFDAMVNSGWADLRFINRTHNPVIIRAFADGTILQVEIFGEPMTEKYSRKSLITEEIPAPASEVVFDDDGEFPDLYEGESLVLKYGRAGYKSEGYLLVTKSGKRVKTKKIRSDKYAPIRGKIIYGRAVKNINNEDDLPVEESSNLPTSCKILKLMN